MDYSKIEEQFKIKLEEIFNSHQSLQDKFDREEFISMFTIKYQDGRPRQPVEPRGKEVDPKTFQLVLAASNDVYP